MAAPASLPATSRRELAGLFLRLGATAFGGPAAHIALMEEEVVRKRQWLRREEFLDLLAATNLIPGPNSTEMALHIGFRRGGWLGFLIAGCCFILPAFLLVTLCAWAYVRFGTLPRVEGLLVGVKPVIIVIVLQALWSLGRNVLKDRLRLALAAGAIAGALAGLNEIALLALTGIAAWSGLWLKRRFRGNAILGLGLLASGVPGTAAATATAAALATPFSLGALALCFLKVGSVLFGSGYVLLAFLEADLVRDRGWLSESQLLDAIAVGQVTPGPVFTTATFVGYVLGGFPGGAVATAAIFAPAFVFVALSGPLVPRLRQSPAAGAFLDGVVVASLALMAVVTVQLGRAALVDAWAWGIAGGAALLVWRLGVNSTWVVLAGAALGLILGAD